MTITLQPHQEQAIQAAIHAGFFRSIDELIDSAIRTLPSDVADPHAQQPRRSMRNVFDSAHGPVADIDFSRNPSMPDSFQKGVEGVLELLRLPGGWNSHAAKPVAIQNAVLAIQVMAQFLTIDTPAALVVPTVHGGIQLEWHTNGVDLEIYVESSKEVTFFAERVGSEESFEGALLSNERELASWLERLPKRHSEP